RGVWAPRRTANGDPPPPNQSHKSGFIVFVRDRRPRPMERLVLVAARRLAVPVKAAVAAAEAQAPRQRPRRLGLPRGLNGVCHLLHVDETEFADHVGLSALGACGILADELCE